MAVLDHDHTSGSLRSVLCRNCNSMEGKVLSSASRAKRSGTAVQWLMNLLAYYKLHSESPCSYLHPTHKTQDEKRELRNKRARERAREKRK